MGLLRFYLSFIDVRPLLVQCMFLSDMCFYIYGCTVVIHKFLRIYNVTTFKEIRVNLFKYDEIFDTFNLVTNVVFNIFSRDLCLCQTDDGLLLEIQET